MPGGGPPGWRYALRRALHVLVVERVADIAATLAFYSVLSLFPALLAVFGAFALAGHGKSSADAFLHVAGQVVPSHSVEAFRTTIEHFATAGGAGLGTVVGIVLALWTATRYVSSFSGALNRVYGVQEGRRIGKRRLEQFGITVAVVTLVAIVLFVVLLWGPLFGAGDGSALARVAWVVARWLLVAIAAVLIIVLLYWGTPNVRQPRVQWLSVGGVTALVLMAAASGAFAFYVSHFPTFHREYGSVAALVVFLVWLWLMNLMLLFGAAWDVELERVRELQAGTDARTALQLPLRDDRRIETLERREQRLEEEAGRFLKARHDGIAGQHPADGAGDAQPRGDDAGTARGLVDHDGHTDGADAVGQGQQVPPGGAPVERAEQRDAAESVGVHERGAEAVRGGDSVQ